MSKSFPCISPFLSTGFFYRSDNIESVEIESVSNIVSSSVLYRASNKVFN